MNNLVKSYKDIKKTQAKDFSLPQLTELRDETFEINGVRFGEADIAPYAIVKIGTKEYRTFSKVLYKQLTDILAHIETHEEAVEVTLKRVKDYYTFE